MLLKIKRSFIAASVSLIAVLGLMTFLAPVPNASAGKCNNDYAFLSFPKWYRSLCITGTDKLEDFKNKNIGDDIVWPIALNVTDILLQVAGIVATFFVIWNGIQHMIARDNKDAAVKTRKGIVQAMVGLALAVMASAIVGFVVANVTGGVADVEASTIISSALSLLWWLLGIIAVVMILYSSFQYLTSKGFEDQALAARRTLLSSIIGLAIVLLAAFITNLVIGLVG